MVDVTSFRQQVEELPGEVMLCQNCPWPCGDYVTIWNIYTIPQVYIKTLLCPGKLEGFDRITVTLCWWFVFSQAAERRSMLPANQYSQDEHSSLWPWGLAASVSGCFMVSDLFRVRVSLGYSAMIRLRFRFKFGLWMLMERARAMFLLSYFMIGL